MSSTPEAVVVVMDACRLKRIWTSRAAHFRYWQFVGLARRWDRDTAEVQVYGRQLPGFDKPAFQKRDR